MNLSYFHTFHLPIKFPVRTYHFLFCIFFLEINQGGVISHIIEFLHAFERISHLSHLGDVPLISEYLFWTDGVKVAPILSGKTDHQVPHLFDSLSPEPNTSPIALQVDGSPLHLYLFTMQNYDFLPALQGQQCKSFLNYLSIEIVTYYLHCQYNYYTDAQSCTITVIHGNMIYTLQDSSMYTF